METFYRVDANIAAIILLVYVIWIASKRLDFKRFFNRFFFISCIIVAIQLAIETITCVINGVEGDFVYVLDNVLHVGLFALAPVISCGWFALIKNLVSPQDDLKSKRNYLFAIPAIVNLVLAIASPFTGWFFSIGPGNIYERGPLFLLSAGITYVYLILALIVIIAKNRYIYKKEFAIFIGATALPILGGVVQSLFYGALMMWAMAAFALVVGYIFIQQSMVRVDSLTGCWTRESFFYTLERRIRFQPERKFAAIYVDIDDLKGINDKFGHFEGDNAIKKVVQLIRISLDNLIIARMGGDEFVVVVDAACNQEVDELVCRIQLAFKEYNDSAKSAYLLNCSFGGALYEEKYGGIYSFLSYVDTLMYKHKKKEIH